MERTEIKIYVEKRKLKKKRIEKNIEKVNLKKKINLNIINLKN